MLFLNNTTYNHIDEVRTSFHINYESGVEPYSVLNKCNNLIKTITVFNKFIK